MIQEGLKFTLSDDSHGHKDVAMHYDKLHSYARECGIKRVYFPHRESIPTGQLSYQEIEI